MSTLVDLLDMIEKPEGVHKINTKLFLISFPQLRCLQKLALESTNFDYSSAEYRVTAIILDIANYRLFRRVRSDVPAEKPKHFMKIKFLNKAVNKENAKLREIVAKGPKYREPNKVNWKATETMFLESTDLYAKNWSKREQVELKYLSEWKDQLKELVGNHISNLKGHFKSPKCKVP